MSSYQVLHHVQNTFKVAENYDMIIYNTLYDCTDVVMMIVILNIVFFCCFFMFLFYGKRGLFERLVFLLCCRYASLYFCCAIEDQDNELITLEIIHRYVELLDKYFGSVRLDLLFSFHSCCIVFLLLLFFKVHT